MSDEVVVSDICQNVQNPDMEINISVPGKVILHGEHSVVYGKLAVAASLGLRTKLKLSLIESPDVWILELLPLKFRHTFDLKELKKRILENDKSIDTSKFNFLLPNEINYNHLLHDSEKAVEEIFGGNSMSNSQVLALRCWFFLISGILHSVNIDFPPFSMSVDTELQIGAGGGSSASFLVTVAASLIQFIRKITSGNHKNLSKTGYNEIKWTKEELDNPQLFSDRMLDAICKWAFYAESIVHGTPSGIDNTICTYGNMVKFRRNMSPDLVNLKNSLNILLINTHVSRETKRMVGNVAKLREIYPEIVNNTLDSLDHISLFAIKFITEIDRDTKSKKTTELYAELNRLVAMNHSLLRSLGVSHRKLDEIVLILEQHGLTGKLTGAGGGGYVMSVVPPHYDVLNVIESLKNRGYTTLFTKLGGPGVTID